MKFNNLLGKVGALSLSAMLATNIGAATLPASAADSLDSVYADKVYIDENFDSYTDAATVSYTNGYKTWGVNYNVCNNGRAFVDEDNGALSGKSMKLKVDTTKGSQFRAGDSNGELTKDPTGYSVSLKFDNFGTDNNQIKIGGFTGVMIGTDGTLYAKSSTNTGSKDYRQDTGFKFKTGKWYTINYRFYEGRIDNVIMVRDAVTNEILMDPYKFSYITAPSATSEFYFSLTASTGSTMYVDNLKIYDAKYYNGVDSVTVSDTSTLALTTSVFGNRVHFKLTDEADSDGKKDVSCETVWVVRNGGEPYEANFTTHTDDSVRVVLGDEGGYYRVYATIKNGDTTVNAGFEWAIQDLDDIVVTKEDGTLTASVHAPKGSLNEETYVLILATFDSNDEMMKANISEQVQVKNQNNTAYDLNVSISDYSGYTVKAFLFDSRLVPKWSGVQTLHTPAAQ